MVEPLKKVLQRNLATALRHHDFTSARELLNSLRAEDPLSVETRGMELEFLVLTKNYTEANALADQLVRCFPNSARVLHLAGRLAYAQRRYNEAEEHFRESARLYPQWFSQLFLGKTLTQLGRFAEAESLLTGLVRDHPAARRDLSWLYERQGEPERALQEIERFLEGAPGDAFAQTQRDRLRSLCRSPDELVEEVEILAELGETVDENVMPQYVASLLQTGKAEQARTYVADQLPQMSATSAVRVGWQCYRLQAYDLSFELFCHGFADNLTNVKLLTAWETSARRADRQGEACGLLRKFAPQCPQLYGRLRRLGKKDTED
ncbi:MAG: tetratricopeptide repeat protein, partial [Planctomycetales bacterium]|nr:tetratricopeptide repeat protein [Planctomycetales bacterium]